MKTKWPMDNPDKKNKKSMTTEAKPSECSEHTPTPWKFKGDHSITDQNGVRIAVVDGLNRVNNAEFLVRAVNSHEALLEAAKQMDVALLAKDSILISDAGMKLQKVIIQVEGGK